MNGKKRRKKRKRIIKGNSRVEQKGKKEKGKKMELTKVVLININYITNFVVCIF